MASVWKRLQRVNKRAAKFQYTASYHRIDLETSPKWKPNKLSIVWTRRSRRVFTDPLDWEPTLKDPLKGCVIFPMPENRTVTVTLFKDSRTNELEDKDWTFVLEDVSPMGKRRRLASSPVNMRQYASLESSQHSLTLTLEPNTAKIVSARLHLTLHCVLLREGHATDEDMQSLASLLSVNNNSDIAVLEDLDEDDYTMSDNSTRQMFDLRQQMEEMTNSLTNSDIAATPNSVQSLNFDNSRTPTAPLTPLTPLAPLAPLTPLTIDRELTPKNPEPDLRIDIPPSKSREYLNNLTKLAMKTDVSRHSSASVKNPNVDTKLTDNLKGVVFKTKHLSKHNLKPLELKTNLNKIGLDRNDNRNGSKESTTAEDLTPVGDVDKLFTNRLDKDKTPVQDLLEWCQEVTSEYRQCKVTNLTTSWRNGLAFCAIIHHFRPDLIDFSGLQPSEPEQTLRIALEASARLGVSRVLTAADVCAKPVPDRLAIMTHLFQLRAHFTGSELQVEQLGGDTDSSSYLVGRHDTDESLPPELFRREVSMRRSRNTHTFTPLVSDTRPSPEPRSPSPTLNRTKRVLRALSPARDSTTRWFTDTPTPTAPTPPTGPIHTQHNQSPPVPPVPPSVPSPPAPPARLMTRKELTDPFGSDDEEDTGLPEPKPSNTVDKEEPPPSELPKPTPQLLSRHDELKERARQLLEATKREAREKDRNRRQSSREREEHTDNTDNMLNGELKNGEVSPKKMSEEERQAALRERARRLIADARAGIVSPSSPSRPPRGTVEIISRQSVLDEIAAAGGVEQLEMLVSGHESRKSSLSPDRSVEEPVSDDNKSIKSMTEEPVRSPLHSFSALVERLTPDRDTQGDAMNESGSYIASEMEALEREQSAIDQRAGALERELRTVMESADNAEEEDRLMSQWFNLVNKKNALLRRQMQLNILEQEVDLSRRCELLARELRLSLGVDEWRKTTGQKRRERLLLQELVSAVNERDRLVQEMDEQEKAIADDDEIERNLTHVEIQRKNNCILQ